MTARLTAAPPGLTPLDEVRAALSFRQGDLVTTYIYGVYVSESYTAPCEIRNEFSTEALACEFARERSARTPDVQASVVRWTLNDAGDDSRQQVADYRGGELYWERRTIDELDAARGIVRETGGLARGA